MNCTACEAAQRMRYLELTDQWVVDIAAHNLACAATGERVYRGPTGQLVTTTKRIALSGRGK